MTFIKYPSEDIWDLLNKLNPETPALWGIMSAQHMVEHLILPLKISRGELVVNVVTPADKVERVKNLMLLSDLPLKRNFEAPFIGSGLLPLNFTSLQSSIDALKNEVSITQNYWQQNSFAIHSHPVFGALNKDEWKVFQSKHFTHHFTQFGLCNISNQ